MATQIEEQVEGKFTEKAYTGCSRGCIGDCGQNCVTSTELTSTVKNCVDLRLGDVDALVLQVEEALTNVQQGANGLSAYELWLEAGNTGTLNDFLASLQGAPGTITNFVPTLHLEGWINTIDFTSVDNDTVSWNAGTIETPENGTFNIVAGSTGNMTGPTTIYLDEANPTQLQISTTASDALGTGKIRVAYASPQAVGLLAALSVFGVGGQDLIAGTNIGPNTITSTQILDGSVTTPKIATGAITANEITYKL